MILESCASVVLVDLDFKKNTLSLSLNVSDRKVSVLG